MVFLIDDEESVRLPLGLSLEHGGYRVVEEGNGRSGPGRLELGRQVETIQRPRLRGRAAACPTAPYGVRCGSGRTTRPVTCPLAAKLH